MENSKMGEKKKIMTDKSVNESGSENSIKESNKIDRKTFIYPKRLKKNKMTLIIGARFHGGVVLVSDRKVTEGNGRFSWKYKISVPEGLPIFFGAAGYSHKAKQFNRKISEIVDSRIREIDIQNLAYFKSLDIDLPKKEKKIKLKKLDTKDLKENKTQKKKNEDIKPVYIYSTENFLEDSQELIKRLCNYEGLSRPDIDVLLAVSTDKARLHHLNFTGDEEELDYCAIGSGAEYIDGFLRKHWKEDMSFEEVLKLCFFCIYYVQDLDHDIGVGMEKSKLPDHLVMTDDDGEIGYWTNIEKEGKVMCDELREEIKKIKGIHDGLNF